MTNSIFSKPVHPILRLAIAIQTLLMFALPPGYAHFNTSLFTPSPLDTLKSGSDDKNTKPERDTKPGFFLKKVVIDAGHGGHDPGCVSGRIYEKDIALGICLKLANAIRTQHPDVQVILTRSTDVFIPLHERAKIANSNAADLFMSVHCNAISKAAHIRGSETYVLGPHKKDENLQVAMRENAAVLLEENYESVYGYDPNSPEAHIIMSMYQNAYLDKSILFADKVEKHFHTTANRHSRGVKQAGFLVLRETAMPSVLIETGFLTNSDDEKYLRSDEGQTRVALALLAAFTDFKMEMEGTIAAVPQPAFPSNTTSVSAPAPDTVSRPAPPPVAAPVSVPAPAPTPDKGIVFKVQLAASANQLDTRAGIWTQVGYPIDALPEGGLIKYQIAAGDLPKAQQIRQQARNIGFSDAFIVAYQNGRKITMEDAKQQLSLK